GGRGGLAGTRLDSAVVVGADETDESLGMPYPAEDGQDAETAGGGEEAGAAGNGQDAETTGGGQEAGTAGRRRKRSDTQDFFVAADRGPGARWGGMSSAIPALRPRRRAASPRPAEARERAIRRRVGVVWGLMVLNCLTYYGSLLGVPSLAGKAITQGALP